MSQIEPDGTATVELLREDGSVQAFTVDDGQTILEATDDADVDLRYGCREGKCVSCTARLVRGDVEYVTDPEALNESQREDGFVLLCVSEPDGECVIEVGKHVLADAFPKLWHTESRATEVQELLGVVEASKELDDVEEVDLDADHLDHLRGAMALFPNLHRVSEAYYRTEHDDE